MNDEKMIHAHGGIRRKIMEGNKKPLMGVVVNCMNLNIRKDPTQAFPLYFFVGLKRLINPLNVEDVKVPVSSNLNPLFIQMP